MTPSDSGAAFSPPADALSLYRGTVMHHRMKPVTHRFSYSVFAILLDLGRLEEASSATAFFSVGRFNLLSFRERDHGPRDGSSLLDHARALFGKAGLALGRGRVLLLCYPRILGYVFDPLSVYFGYDEHGVLRGVLYEVRNTFGEHHTYVEPITPGQLTKSGLRQEREKLFFVSPFNDLAMHYLFRLSPPTETNVGVRILVKDRVGPLLAATFHGKHAPATNRVILSLFLTIPALTFKIIVGIHIEALWLWVKGLRLMKRPASPPPASFRK